MSKTPDDKSAADAAPVLQKATPAVAPARTFRDKVYTSRTLILPDSGRALAVLKQRVSVPGTDAEALDYLKSNEEFELLQE